MATVTYDGSTVMVTGASSGIGREMARQVAARAERVLVVARREQRLRELKEEVESDYDDVDVVVVPCDLSQPESIDAMVEDVRSNYGPIDVLINNAGLGHIGLTETTEPEKLQLMIDVNVAGLTRLTRHLLPDMVDAGHGGVLNISSGFGLTFMPGFAAYVGTKHYVTGFTESLRLELAGTGVVATQVCPGPVRTEFEERAENPTGRSVPSLLEMSAERCARISLRSLEKGRALVVPGFLLTFLVLLGRLTPRWVLRLIYYPVGRHFRKLETRDVPPSG